MSNTCCDWYTLKTITAAEVIEPLGDPLLDVILEPGDILYVPCRVKGVWVVFFLGSTWDLTFFHVETLVDDKMWSGFF